MFWLLRVEVQVFCPRCGDLYFPSGYIRACDGAFWGTTFPHLLLLRRPDLEAEPNPHGYIPRVFGFKVHTGTGGADGEKNRNGEVHLASNDGDDGMERMENIHCSHNQMRINQRQETKEGT